jgi:hypothetical protein
MVGTAGAVKPGKTKADTDEVTVVTLRGGPVETTAPGTGDTILLNGESEFTFTQKADVAVQVILSNYIGWDESDVTFCDGTTIVYADGLPLGARVDFLARKVKSAKVLMSEVWQRPLRTGRSHSQPSSVRGLVATGRSRVK